MTRRLGVGDTGCADPELAAGAAVLATRLLDVPGPEPVTRALMVAVAELRIEAGWAAFDAGLCRHALYHYARALELARQAGDAYCQVLALGYAGLASVLHGHPDDGLKQPQCAQVAAWGIPSDDQLAVVVGESGRAAVEATGLADSAIAFALLGEQSAAGRALVKGRDLWPPSRRSVRRPGPCRRAVGDRAGTSGRRRAANRGVATPVGRWQADQQHDVRHRAGHHPRQGGGATRTTPGPRRDHHRDQAEWRANPQAAGAAGAGAGGLGRVRREGAGPHRPQDRNGIGGLSLADWRPRLTP